MAENSELKPPLFPEPILLGATLFLVGISLVMIYSTTGVLSQERFGDPLYFVKRQAVAAFIGILALYGASKVPVETLRKVAPWMSIITMLLLLLPLIPGLGATAGGASRWVVIGPIRFQPGELAKVSIIVWLAGYLARHEHELSSFIKGVIQPISMVLVSCALFLVQPDFGSSVIVVLVSLGMIVASGARLRYFIASGVILAIGAAALILSSPYRLSRLQNFLEPWKDASGKGYQLIQSLIAVGTGEVTGVGLGASQQKLFFLPAAHTDFIFAVIAEEMGFIGCVGVLAVFLVILWRGVLLAGRVSDRVFSFALALGLTMLIIVPAMLNVGVVTGLLPTKGLVLPLVGYGGSSLIANLIVVGLLCGLARALRRRATV